MILEIVIANKAWHGSASASAGAREANSCYSVELLLTALIRARYEYTDLEETDAGQRNSSHSAALPQAGGPNSRVRRLTELPSSC